MAALAHVVVAVTVELHKKILCMDNLISLYSSLVDAVEQVESAVAVTVAEVAFVLSPPVVIVLAAVMLLATIVIIEMVVAMV